MAAVRSPAVLVFRALSGAGIRALAIGNLPHRLVGTSAAAGGGLNVSEACVQRMKQIADPGAPLLRVTVEGGGCSGFQYKFNLDSTVNRDDVVVEKDGVKVVIDETSLQYVRGATVDFHEELIRSSFRIVDNPRAEQGCSCGASFSIKIQ